MMIYPITRSKVFLLLQTLMVLATHFQLVLGFYNTEYSECTYNGYQYRCEGTDADFRSRGLTEFPDIGRAQCVVLKDNRISRFPDNLQTLTAVKHLEISNNRISQIPNDLSDFGMLEVLDLSRNQIASLSSAVKFPASLRSLLLAGNQLSTLPSGLKVPGLFVLDLSGNQFADVPSSFCLSDQLTRVDFTQNRLNPDTTLYMNTLNQCRNINRIPFCFFIDHQAMKCDCTTLYPVLGETPAFCLGTPLRGQAMTCDPETSADEYRNKKLIQLSKTEVGKGCNFALMSQSGANSVISSTLTKGVALVMVYAVSIVTSH